VTIVERILMVSGEVSGCKGVSDAYRQRREAAFLHLLLKVIWRGELPQRFLDGDLPRARGRHHDYVRRI
jgi:hypothetical protein